MESKKYIGLIQEERDDDFTIGYKPSSNLSKMKKWKEEMLECSNIIDCKIFELKEYVNEIK